MAMRDDTIVGRAEHDGVAVLTLWHGKANALDLELVGALTQHLKQSETSPDTRAVVLTGAGSIFSAGVDLFRVVDGGGDYVRLFVPALVALFTTLFTFRRPVVAAVNGHAIAGGCVIAAACDYRVMADGPGTVGVPELRAQVPFPSIAIEILRFTAHAAHFQELVYMGRTYAAREAHALGLIDEIVPATRCLDRARDVAERLAAIPPATFALTKAQLRRLHVERVERTGDDTAVLRIWEDPATHEGLRRYLREKFGR